MNLQNEFSKIHQRFDELDQKFITKKDAQAFATKEDLKHFATKSDVEKFATKEDLDNQTRELKDYADEQTEHLVAVISATIATPLQKHFDEHHLYSK